MSIGGRTLTKLRFADDINGLAGEEHELASLVGRLDETSTELKKIGAEKISSSSSACGGMLYPVADLDVSCIYIYIYIYEIFRIF